MRATVGSNEVAGVDRLVRYEHGRGGSGMRLRDRRLTAVVSVVVGALAFATLPAAAPPPPGAVDLDVLFVGAHPDDEIYGFISFGQWEEHDGLEAGVVSLTRGEGGGDPHVREVELRNAVGLIDADVFFLDVANAHFNTSAAVADAAWGDAALERLVRLIRVTRPEVLLSMHPYPREWPLERWHGEHQEAARLTREAYDLAGDAGAYRHQITAEGLAPWTPLKLVMHPDALTAVTPGSAAESVVGGVEGVDGSCTREGELLADAMEPWWLYRHDVPGTRMSLRHGRPWGTLLADHQRSYPSQGKGGTEQTATLLALGSAVCEPLYLLHSRVPFTPGRTGPTATFEGIHHTAPRGLALGTRFEVHPAEPEIAGGRPLAVTAVASGPAASRLDAGRVTLAAPDGWDVSGDGLLRPEDDRWTAAFTVTPPAGVAPGYGRLTATLSTATGSGANVATVEVVPPIELDLPALPRTADFREWATEWDVRFLDLLDLAPRTIVGAGLDRDLTVGVTNHTPTRQDVTVTFEAPAGLAVEPDEVVVRNLQPGATRSVTVTLRSTDVTLPTSRGGSDHPLAVTATTSALATTETVLINLVPGTTVPAATAAPTVDGVRGPGEYVGAPVSV
ncbi:MAG TPA: PIG-L family deacetylase, partial [Nitriliruptorales bacterium]